MKVLSEKTICKILLVLVLVLLTALGWALKSREDFHRELAQKNVDVWEEMLHDVKTVLEVCREPKDINDVLAIAGNSFGLFSSHQTDSWPSMYSSLVGSYQSLEFNFYVPEGETSGDKPPTKETLEAFELFLAMNEDIRDLCQSVVDRCYKEQYGVRTGPDWKFRKGLIDYKSDIYKEVYSEIQELARKYEEILKEYKGEDTIIIH